MGQIENAVILESEAKMFSVGSNDIKPDEQPEDWVRRILGSRRYRYYRNEI